jgi:7-carboxy-7-deazaguanine synthase
MQSAPIIEIFSSIQGEGTRVGERHLFVRFEGCSLSCQYCDTPATFVKNPECRIEWPPFSKKFERVANPLSVQQLNEQLDRFSVGAYGCTPSHGQTKPIISITGGEPLEKVAFLKEWLPTIKDRYQILLEAAGVHFNELKEVIDLIDIVSMDLKIPSATGMRAYWDEHKEFLEIAKEKEVYVKTVVSAETSDDEVEKAAMLIVESSPKIPLIIQPASAFAKFRSEPSLEQCAHWQQLASKKINDVRIVPQLHKALKIL